MLISVFWLSLIGLFYIAFGYPILLFIVARMRPRPVSKANITPSVSVIIAAYNEEDSIKDRIENCLNLDYPADKLEVLIASDGSTDRTNSIVAEYRNKGVRLLAGTKRNGKLGAINRAVPQATGEILVFSDANSHFERTAVSQLVKNFNDPQVGCVAGQKVIRPDFETDTSASEGIYWKYEHFLKKYETVVHSAMGADGSIYAIRKELYFPPEESIGYADDGIISMRVIQEGFRLVYEEQARNHEVSSDHLGSEFKRKIRTLSGGLEWVGTLKPLLVPFFSSVWWQLWSHRLLRFSIPFLLAIALVSNVLLIGHSSLYLYLFITQCIVYLLGLGAVAGLKLKICRISFYLTFMNFVFVPAMAKYLFGKSDVAWEKRGR